ncbi:galactose-1-epimerase [Klebsiella pneumoniae]|nr:galactose-1-epimerase [Klebsiella pneumoniae]
MTVRKCRTGARRYSAPSGAAGRWQPAPTAKLGCAKLEHCARQSRISWRLGVPLRQPYRATAASRFDGQLGQRHAVINDAGHQLHGVSEGFDKRRWRIVHADEQEVLFALTSPDGDQALSGHPAVATAQYRLTDDNRIAITHRATVDQPCPVNMTNHVYFNSDGEQGDVRQHQLQILAQRYLPVESDGIPGGELKDVANTSFDFRQPKTIAADFLADADQQKVKRDTIMPSCWMPKAIASQPAAQVWSMQDGKLQMTVYTSAPALQFYSGATISAAPRRRRDGALRRLVQGPALESEFLPDSPEPSAMAAAGLCITSKPGVRQPDGISVYRQPDNRQRPPPRGAAFRPRPPLCRLFFQQQPVSIFRHQRTKK